MALMCLIPVTTLHADDNSDHRWFVGAGASVYSKTNIKVDTLLRTRSVSYHDYFSGYSMWLGRDWEWLAAGMYFSGLSIDKFRAQTLTGRVTMQVFPIENLPYLLVEYGLVQVNNSDLHLHKRAGVLGIGTGVRFDMTNTIFFDVSYIYSVNRINFDIADVPISVRAKRWNIGMGLGYRF